MAPQHYGYFPVLSTFRQEIKRVMESKRVSVREIEKVRETESGVRESRTVMITAWLQYSVHVMPTMGFGSLPSTPQFFWSIDRRMGYISCYSIAQCIWDQNKCPVRYTASDWSTDSITKKITVFSLETWIKNHRRHSVLDSLLSIHLTKSAKTHDSSRLDYKASKRETIALEPTRARHNGILLGQKTKNKCLLFPQTVIFTSTAECNGSFFFKVGLYRVLQEWHVFVLISVF